jgi:choline dehydrogenase-like flavoprotein
MEEAGEREAPGMTLSRTKYDLIVIGAGPAGCAAAITAARTGASVLLHERGHFPRHKVCGEFVSAESLDPSGKNAIGGKLAYPGPAPRPRGSVQQDER